MNAHGNQLVPGSGGALPPGSVVLAAHPDDETIGAAVLLSRTSRAVVIHLTDGAPRDPTLWPRHFKGSREAYAMLRHHEARLALSMAGVTQDRMYALGGADQDAVRHLPALVHAAVERISALHPPVLVIHAYEGGHPDHDAAALVGRAAVMAMRHAGLQAPALVEMTSYHADRGRLVSGHFLPSRETVLGLAPTVEEARLKARMLAAYESQAEVLRSLTHGEERFRTAPAVDFSEAPHSGTLWYELKGWMRGEEFRALAVSALRQLGLPADS